MTYSPATSDQILALEVNAGILDLAQDSRFAEVSPDLVQAIAEGAGQFAAGEWAPLSRVGDIEGARLVDGKVILPEGFKEAYQAYVEQGWSGVSATPEYGGQGLPHSLSACVVENTGTANFALAILPMLSVAAMEALQAHGSKEQKDRYLSRLISGEWSGTMNLTEPQAGSDVGALTTTATRIEDGPDAGKFQIKGTKIFISWGEHDLSENIINLVLARIPGAPAGSRGISLFIVPKYRVNEDGSLGEQNDIKAASMEHKMGIHASPTCVTLYGDEGDCIGELIGAENEGLKCMFTMMNDARVNVGNQGIQIAESALQMARAYAAERIQSPRAGSPDKNPVAIIEHPDVRRMILRMRALTEAARALLYYTTGQLDRATIGDAIAGMRAEVLVPMLKAWGTDTGCEVASLGIQVHGGMGYIEETGAAQPFRDARITPIYEGTNGIQAADLVTRKLALDNGGAFFSLMRDIEGDCDEGSRIGELAQSCAAIAKWFQQDASLDDRLAGSVPFCTMCAVAVAGWQLQRQARSEKLQEENPVLAEEKELVARYFEAHIASEALGLQGAAKAGANILYELSSGRLAG